MADSETNEIAEIEELLSEEYVALPKITRSSHNKTISVKNCFYLMPPTRKVIVTVVAEYEAWMDFERNPETVTFYSIPFSKKTSKRNLTLLKEYFENRPELFKLTFFSEFTFRAVFHNPKHQYGKKSRGIKSYFFDEDDLAEAKISAIHLYIFIKHWSEKLSEDPKTQLPEEYKRIEKLFGGKVYPREIPFCVMKLLDDYYGTSILGPVNNGNTGSDETERQRIFMKNYIYSGKKWKPIEKLYKRYGYCPLKISDAVIKKEEGDPPPAYHPLYQPLLRVIL